MYVIEMLSINTTAVRLTLAITGFILTSLGIAIPMYYKSFTENGERFEASVVKIRETQNYTKNLIQVVPVVEYMIDGRLRKAEHFLPVFKNTLDFTVGDTITIIVNPKHPATFMLESYDIKTLRKNYWIVLLLGIAFIAAAVIAYIFF